MKTNLWRGRTALVAVVAGILMQASCAWAQVQNLQPAVPRIGEDNRPSSAVPWAIGFCFALLILLISFKNSRRTHLD